MSQMGSWKTFDDWESTPMRLGTFPVSQIFSSSPCGSYEKVWFFNPNLDKIRLPLSSVDFTSLAGVKAFPSIDFTSLAGV